MDTERARTEQPEGDSAGDEVFGPEEAYLVDDHNRRMILALSEVLKATIHPIGQPNSEYGPPRDDSELLSPKTHEMRDDMLRMIYLEIYRICKIRYETHVR